MKVNDRIVHCAFGLLAKEIYEANKKKGFYEDRSSLLTTGNNDVTQAERIYIGNKLMLIVGELAEAHEGLRHGNPPSEHIPKFSALEEELADTIIRILDLSGYQNLRIEEAIEAKIAYNATRPHKHGKKF